jgi:hypothetical protein
MWGLVGGGDDGVDGELPPQAAMPIAHTLKRSRTRTLCCARCGPHNQRYCITMLPLYELFVGSL